MSKHTPGPWSIEEYGDDDAPALVIHKDSRTRVCFMATPGSHGDPAKIEANARLIAAAPDMLEAIRKTITENLHLADGDNCTLRHLKEAIAKVERVAPIAGKREG